jgi:hypothetical protein
VNGSSMSDASRCRERKRSRMYRIRSDSRAQSVAAVPAAGLPRRTGRGAPRSRGRRSDRAAPDRAAARAGPGDPRRGRASGREAKASLAPASRTPASVAPPRPRRMEQPAH